MGAQTPQDCIVIPSRFQIYVGRLVGRYVLSEGDKEVLATAVTKEIELEGQ